MRLAMNWNALSAANLCNYLSVLTVSIFSVSLVLPHGPSWIFRVQYAVTHSLLQAVTQWWHRKFYWIGWMAYLSDAWNAIKQKINGLTLTDTWKVVRKREHQKYQNYLVNHGIPSKRRCGQKLTAKYRWLLLLKLLISIVNCKDHWIELTKCK